MTSTSWRAVRVVAGLVVLGVVLWRTGSGPFVHGLRSIDAWTLLLGAAIAVPTTLCCAWRWHLVARGLGVGVDLGTAFASYYRSQFLNTTLPGGVIGDLHRGVLHGRSVGDAGLGIRAVVWERLAGQAVQGVLALAILLALPSPVRSAMPGVLVLLAAVLLTAGVFGGLLTHGGTSRVARVLHAAGRDARSGLLDRRVWPGAVLASTVAVAGHVATYLVAARAVGITAPPDRLLPLVLLVLLGMALPLNVAGWGPREGVAAWSFGAAGLGVGQGVAAAVAYGAIVTVATLPGAVVLVLAGRRRTDARAELLVPSTVSALSAGDGAR